MHLEITFYVEIAHEAFAAEQIMFPQDLAMAPSHLLFPPTIFISWLYSDMRGFMTDCTKRHP